MSGILLSNEKSNCPYTKPKLYQLLFLDRAKLCSTSKPFPSPLPRTFLVKSHGSILLDLQILAPTQQIFSLTFLSDSSSLLPSPDMFLCLQHVFSFTVLAFLLLDHWLHKAFDHCFDRFRLDFCLFVLYWGLNLKPSHNPVFCFYFFKTGSQMLISQADLKLMSLLLQPPWL